MSQTPDHQMQLYSHEKYFVLENQWKTLSNTSIYLTNYISSNATEYAINTFYGTMKPANIYTSFLKAVILHIKEILKEKLERKF